MASDDRDVLFHEISGWYIGTNLMEITIRANGYNFLIPISPDTFSNSPTRLALFRDILNKMSADDPDDSDAWDWGYDIADIFLAEFKRLAPPAVHSGKLTLADLADRGTFDCEYRVVDEKPVAGPVTEHVDEMAPSEESNVHKIQSTFPVIDPLEVEVPYRDGEHIFDIIPDKVTVHGQQFFFKKSWAPRDLLAEIKKHVKIKTSELPPEELRISHLHGIVAGPDGQTKGLLYEFIETIKRGVLREAMTPDIPMSDREKWASQIRETVAKLHGLGLVWGNVEANNVIIDKENNAIIVGIEGGTTTGWVDRELDGTVQGDEQGLERLTDFIFNDESPLRRGPASDAESSQED
ncbi:hypothetical protein ACJ41O_007232 [Fusarium nematophilum]